MARALWIADKLREHGVRVVEVAGWQTRGSDTFNPRGVVAHHTAGGAGEAPSLNICINGRSGLPGPLANIVLGRSGTAYVIAAGRANHAGVGGWNGLSGNSSVFGIEAENRGYDTDPWPGVQLDAYYKICRALIEGVGVGADRVCGHKEWATPRGRKIDPHSLDMNDFRNRVANINSTPAPTPPPPQQTNVYKIGSTGPKVVEIQNICNFWGWNAGAADGIYGPATAEGVKRAQQFLKVPADGIWGPQTDLAYYSFIAYLGTLVPSGRPTIRKGDTGEDVRYAQSKLGYLKVDGIFGEATRLRVVKMQRLWGLVPDGVIGPKTWSKIG